MFWRYSFIHSLNPSPIDFPPPSMHSSGSSTTRTRASGTSITASMGTTARGTRAPRAPSDLPAPHPDPRPLPRCPEDPVCTVSSDMDSSPDPSLLVLSQGSPRPPLPWSVHAEPYNWFSMSLFSTGVLTLFSGNIDAPDGKKEERRRWSFGVRR